MKLYYKNDSVSLYHGDMLEVLDTFKDNSIDCIVTDPPYELNFMNKGWDNTGIVFNIEMWKKCLRVLKPGGYLLCFGASRIFHRVFCAIEDAGFEVRDIIMWLYGSGFPKSMNIGKTIEGKLTVDDANLGKQWSGWGTALKPSYEPIMIARKPFEGSLIDNVLKNGVGGFNIDECRVGTEYIDGGTAPDFRDIGKMSKEIIGQDKLSFGQVENAKRISYEGHIGRYPANVILTYNDSNREEVCGGLPNTKSAIRKPSGGKILNPENGWNNNSMTDTTVRGFADEGSAARYFENCDFSVDDLEDIKRYYYCPKASKKDGNDGVKSRNIHPTVKPTSLLRYLVRLVAPKGATVLDPFNGSGSTGKACMLENVERCANYKYIGIDLSEEYLNISKARINWVFGTECTSSLNSSMQEPAAGNAGPGVIKKTKLW